MAQTVKNLLAMQETLVQLSLGWEDPLEKEMANYSSNLAWEIPWTEEPEGLQSMGLQNMAEHLTSSIRHVVEKLQTLTDAGKKITRRAYAEGKKNVH